MSGEVWCTDGKTVYVVEFDRIKAGTGGPRFKIRLEDGSVHRLAYPRALREKLGLGKVSLAEFAAAHPLPPPDRPCIPGTNVLVDVAWAEVKPL
jgi:hypothetical protein